MVHADDSVQRGVQESVVASGSPALLGRYDVRLLPRLLACVEQLDEHRYLGTHDIRLERLPKHVDRTVRMGLPCGGVASRQKDDWDLAAARFIA